MSQIRRYELFVGGNAKILPFGKVTRVEHADHGVVELWIVTDENVSNCWYEVVPTGYLFDTNVGPQWLREVVGTTDRDSVTGLVWHVVRFP